MYSAFDGVFIALDLCEKDEKALEQALGKYLDAGTEISEAQARKLVTPANGSGEVDPATIRAWAAAQNPPIKLGLKGRIPESVTAQYLAAHPANPPQGS